MLHSQPMAGIRGFGVLPKNAFGYPKAMLAKPVTGWEKSGLRRRSDGVVLASFLYSGQTIQCGADDVSLFGQPDFCGHGVADLLAAYHQHPAPAQLLAGDVVKICVPGGRILDPFCGAGTTVLAARLEGYEAVGIEVTDAYYKLGSDRVRFALEAQSETAE